MGSVMLYLCIFCVALLMDLFVLCVVRLSVWSSCLVISEFPDDVHCVVCLWVHNTTLYRT